MPEVPVTAPSVPLQNLAGGFIQNDSRGAFGENVAQAGVRLGAAVGAFGGVMAEEELRIQEERDNADTLDAWNSFQSNVREVRRGMQDTRRGVNARGVTRDYEASYKALAGDIGQGLTPNARKSFEQLTGRSISGEMGSMLSFEAGEGERHRKDAFTAGLANSHTSIGEAWQNAPMQATAVNVMLKMIESNGILNGDDPDDIKLDKRTNLTAAVSRGVTVAIGAKNTDAAEASLDMFGAQMDGAVVDDLEKKIAAHKLINQKIDSAANEANLIVAFTGNRQSTEGQQKAWGAGLKLINARADREDLPASERERQIRLFVSRAATSSVAVSLSEEDTTSAQRTLDQYSSEMEPTVVAKLQSEIRNSQKVQSVDALSESTMPRAEVNSYNQENDIEGLNARLLQVKKDVAELDIDPDVRSDLLADLNHRVTRARGEIVSSQAASYSTLAGDLSDRIAAGMSRAEFDRFISRQGSNISGEQRRTLRRQFNAAQTPIGAAGEPKPIKENPFNLQKSLQIKMAIDTGFKDNKPLTQGQINEKIYAAGPDGTSIPLTQAQISDITEFKSKGGVSLPFDMFLDALNVIRIGDGDASTGLVTREDLQDDADLVHAYEFARRQINPLNTATENNVQAATKKAVAAVLLPDVQTLTGMGETTLSTALRTGKKFVLPATEADKTRIAKQWRAAGHDTSTLTAQDYNVINTWQKQPNKFVEPDLSRMDRVPAPGHLDAEDAHGFIEGVTLPTGPAQPLIDLGQQ